VLDPYFFSPEAVQERPHRIQYLLDALSELAMAIERLGSRLIVVPGRSVDVVPRLAEQWKVDQVVAQAWADPIGRKRDQRIVSSLRVPFRLLGGETLLPPGALRSHTGLPYSVFSAFAKAFYRDAEIGTQLPFPSRLPPVPEDVTEEGMAVPSPESLGLRRNPNLLGAGEVAAQKRLKSFLEGAADDYHRTRDRMDLEGTSRLSADLHFGTLSPRQVWIEVGEALAKTAPLALAAFRNELLWREFAHASVWAHPEVLQKPMRPNFDNFPWRTCEEDWQAWVMGRTGYPVVDAAARQLYAEGFIHNRARMIAASFLVKDLRLDYRRGEAHYLKFLVDGDPIQNNAGWQWCAGSGFDAQPWFRIFNPVLQGRKFDPEGEYVKRWIPELADLPARYLHAPWEAPASVLWASGIELGVTYPSPMVDHAVAREAFLRIMKNC
jgi:deoxyribodipyrimidine photo-lyase